MPSKVATLLTSFALTAPASADITFVLNNTTFTGFNFVEVANPWLPPTGTLTGATINVTLNASVAYTYADDLCIYVDVAPLSTGGFLQCGGFSNLSAAQRYSWPNGGSSAFGTTSIGTVNFTTPLSFTGNPAVDGTIWIGNGYGSAGTSGTWTGTVTLHGIEGCLSPQVYFRDLDGDGFGSAASGTITTCTPPPGYVGSNNDCNDNNPSITTGATWFRDLDGDGFGASASGTITACNQPGGYAASNDDCNDSSAQFNPNTTWYRDADGDGIGAVQDGTIVQCAPPAGYALANGDNCPPISNPNQADANSNGFGDACEFARGDLNLDQIVSASDVPLFLNLWGATGSSPADFNFDGIVGAADFSILLSNWGTQP